jgi:hypothetical protein
MEIFQMEELEFPDVLFCIYVNAEGGKNIRAKVIEIPCKRLNKVVKTASGKSIKLADIMRPFSILDKRLVMEHIYCLDEKEVQPAIVLLVERAMKKADELLAHAKAVRDAAYAQVIVNYEQTDK